MLGFMAMSWLTEKQAKLAALSVDITFDKLPPSDLRAPIGSYVLGKWQERWASPLLANKKKYKSIKSHYPLVFLLSF